MERSTEGRDTSLLGFLLISELKSTNSTSIGQAVFMNGKSAEFLFFRMPAFLKQCKVDGETDDGLRLLVPTDCANI